MSNKTADIFKALNAQLKTWANIPSLVQWPNQPSSIEPSSDDAFLIVSYIPTATDAPTLDGSGFEINDGIYQVMIAIPKSSGEYGARVWSDEVKATFARTGTYTSNDANVKVRKVEINQGRYINENHYAIPVSVYFRVVG